jgi:RHS repeat-associated protein
LYVQPRPLPTQRFKQVTPEGTTLYFDAFGVHAELVIGSSSTRWNEYLSVGNQPVGVRFVDTGTSAVTTRYFHTDHLGSISVITNEAAVVVQRLSYDAWGKRRFTNGADDPTGSVTTSDQTTAGFTGEEELSIGGLVHLNGRIYDPMLGRMLSADPAVPDTLNAQAWNRYSYVGNSPLTFTDPSGHSWLSSFFGNIGGFFKSILSNPIVRAVLQIGLTWALPFIAPVAAAIAAAAVTGLAGGKLSDILRAGFIAGGTALAFFAVGSATVAVANTSGADAARIFNVASHAGVGCLSSVASGGECGAGALSGGISAAADPLLPQDFMGGTIGHGIVGGLASLAGGGKFENGAVTGAFGYLFNSMLHPCGRDPLGCNLPEGGGGNAGGRGTLEVGAAVENWFSGVLRSTGEAFHYTFGRFVSSIENRGLLAGSYVTPSGTLSPMQAQIDLALSPNRGLTDTVLRIDINGLRAAGYEIPPIFSVMRYNGMPGGGYEMKFPYDIPPKYITVVPK